MANWKVEPHVDIINNDPVFEAVPTNIVPEVNSQ